MRCQSCVHNQVKKQREGEGGGRGVKEKWEKGGERKREREGQTQLSVSFLSGPGPQPVDCTLYLKGGSSQLNLPGNTPTDKPRRGFYMTALTIEMD